MKAVVFTKLHEARLMDVPDPKLTDSRDAIVKVRTTSICGSDLHIIHLGSREVGCIIGHEFTGEVVETGKDVGRFRPGQRVLGYCTVQCGVCEACRSGNPVYCENGLRYSRQIPGAQAEYVRVPFADASLHPIPDGLADEQVIFAGDILSTGYMGAKHGEIRPGDAVAVFGAGPVGLCAVVSARLFGAGKVIAVDMLPYRLEMAKRMGADYTVDASISNAPEEIRRITGGSGADVTIEAVGVKDTLLSAIASTRNGGKCSVVGLFGKPFELPIHTMGHQGLRLQMSVVNMVDVPRLVGLIRDKKIDLLPLITHKFPLAEAERAYEVFDKKMEGCVKVILYP
ncbi:MAG: zinc-dependent alcohol dehydrogenase [Bacillota bacterium]|jgi:alcohol dehydrogenase